MKYENHNLIYFTQDLIEREDFAESTRYHHYKSINTKNIFLNLINLDDAITNVPVFDTQTAKDSKAAQDIIKDVLRLTDENSDTPYADSEIQRRRVICSLLGIEKRPDLFKQIIEKVSPFILVCPEGKKCEWFDIVNDKCMNANDCIGCIECILKDAGKEDEIDSTKKCCYHGETYDKQGHGCVWTVLESFKDIFQNCVLHDRKMNDYLDLFSKLVGKIPIFEYSSAVDILRWHTFNEAIKNFHDKLHSREKALRNSFGKGLRSI